MKTSVLLCARLLIAVYALHMPGNVADAAACSAEATAYLLQAQDIHNTNERIAAYQNALRLDPACSNASINLSVIFMDANRFEEAITLLEKGHNLDPENQLLRKNLVAAYINLGYNYAQAGKQQEAIPLYEKALNVDPVNSIAVGNISSAYTNLGVQFYNQGEHQKAWEMFCKAVAVKPDNQTARTNLRNLFTEECPNTFTDPPASSPISDTQDIGAMVLHAIAAWQAEAGRTLSDREKDRIVNEYLSSVRKCGVMSTTIRQNDMNGLIAGYLNLLQDGRKATLLSCDPLR